MKKLSKNITVVLLCAALMVVQAGCAKNTEDNIKDKNTATPVPVVSAVPVEDEPEDNVTNSMWGTEPVEAGINVSRIEGIKEDFICGADISSIKSEYESGVKYYDFEGNELKYAPLEGEKGFFSFLKECGINWVRIRIWNNPYDEEGNCYGGGNNDLDTAIEIGKLATDAGIRVLIDFHYSDFWADPGKYQAPKAWKDMDIDKKAEALEVYTVRSLTSLVDGGVDVGMVQIGNETVNGLAGETDWKNICRLMNEGSKAVYYVADTMEKEMLVVLHFTDISETRYGAIAGILEDNQVNYDVFATSYYPFWHGTTQNLADVMKNISEEYGKKVMVAETSYVYTLKDGDGHKQSVGRDSRLPLDYDVSVQGQADAVADVIQAVASIGETGLGVFYWEPAWIPVQVYNKNEKGSKRVLRQNKKIWEEKGSGWATSSAGSYDPGDAGRWYGGSSWDNQALFDFKGNPLESVNVFKYVFTGTVKK
ncbi:MAG: cellulase family glycosylhydrolase [Lachnospiraceae bacterium]|nr:cellulase family glycosylhydrolase [Lachnospiraceae bacterium]